MAAPLSLIHKPAATATRLAPKIAPAKMRLGTEIRPPQPTKILWGGGPTITPSTEGGAVVGVDPPPAPGSCPCDAAPSASISRSVAIGLGVAAFAIGGAIGALVFRKG